MTISPDLGELSPKQERRWYRVWVFSLIAFFVLAGTGALYFQWSDKRVQEQRNRLLLDPAADDPDVTATAETSTEKAIPVTIGFYLERIPELSTRDASWTVVFDVWFRWQGSDLDPATALVVMEGTIESREQLATYRKGDLNYQRYRMVAKITKPFDVAQIPLDNHLLILAVENGELVRERMIFVPDEKNTSLSSRVSVPGYRIAQWKALEKAHSYKTTRGDPRLPPGTKSTYSQFRLGVLIQRDSWGLYLKMFQALHIAVAIAFLSCFIKPTDVDPRFGLGVGALFAAVANSYLVSTLVPDTGEMALADVINGLGILTILVTLIESTISLYLYDRCGELELSARLDRISFRILVTGFVTLNFALLVGSIF